MIIVGMGSMGLLLCGLVTASCALLSSNAATMTIRVVGDELILSGPVTRNELQRVQNALATSPFVSTVILRN